MTLPQPIKVMIVDDDPTVRSALAEYVAQADDMAVVAHCESGNKAVAQAPILQPDVVLMDVQMPDGNGIEATAKLVERLDHITVIVLTTFDTDEAMLSALAAGAKGFLLKDVPPEVLRDVIRNAHRGIGTILAPETAARVAQQSSKTSDPSAQTERLAPSDTAADQIAEELGLTRREREVLALLCKAASNAEIGKQLCISESTVKGYVSSAMMKLGVSSRLKAVICAFELGIAGAPSLADDDDDLST